VNDYKVYIDRGVETLAKIQNKANFKHIKTAHAHYIILLDFPMWYVGDDFLLNKDSNAFYNLSDGSGNIRPHDLLMIHARKAYQYMKEKGYR